MHKRYLICLLDSNILLTIRLFSAQNDIAIRFYFNKATVKYGAFNKHWKEPFYRLLDIRSYFNNAAVKYGAFNKHWKEPFYRLPFIICLGRFRLSILSRKWGICIYAREKWRGITLLMLYPALL